MTFPDPPVLLMQSGAFTCPRCGPTNAVAQLINCGTLANVLSGFCNRCEHWYQLSVGAPSTTTTGTSNTQGATALTVAAGAAFSTVGALVVIDSTSVDGGAEVLTVSSAGSSTSIPIANTPLRLTHAAGATVNTAVMSPLGPMT